MKKPYFFILVLISSSLFSLPKVCLNMIVKNESHCIRRCLESVKPMIDYWVILDTGSTDGTQDVIKEFMKEIPGELHESPFVNFEYSRNEALSLAHGKSEYILIIDADDILVYEPGFILPRLDKEGYYMRIDYSGTSYSRIHLFRNNSDWSWAGVVHEALTGPTWRGTTFIEGVRMKIVGGGGRSFDPKRFERDAALLEEALKKDPQNSRNMFYLGQSYFCAGMYEKAIEVYERRIAMGGWEQEVYFSLYQIANAKIALNRPEEEISKAYYRAYEYRPIRGAEPLYKLSRYYRERGNFLLAYNLAKFGLEFEEPNDPVFVESWIHQYGLLFELSISAYWVGHYVESIKACRQLLSDPNLPSDVRAVTEKNIGYSIDKLSPETGNNSYKK